MAIDLYSDSFSTGISPRISFSHDLSQTDGVPIEQYIRSSPSSSVDFDFCVFRESFDQESSSADELFSDGKILPTEIKRKSSASKKTEPPAFPPPLPAPPHEDESCGEKRVEVLESELQKSNSKSFWGFKRSSSLNCGSGYARTLCPIPLLSRSNSTGSSTNGKRTTFVKDNLTSRLQKSSTKPSQLPEKSPAGRQKPPLKKSYGPYGVKISPVLNVPSPLLFGLGSIFSPSKDKNKKR